MSLYGSTNQSDIRVGYISPTGGYVTNVSVADANAYNKLVPGTIFIFENGDDVRYLTIDEVNQLTAEDMLRPDQCSGLELDAPCPPVEVFFFGGEGIGAKGNPIIGVDGSLLAVDLISGGSGYQDPPFIDIIDECRIGAGGVARAVIDPDEGDFVQPGNDSGRGVVVDVIIDDPGNSYSGVELADPLVSDGTSNNYPVTLRLKNVVVENPGINYGCPGESLQITPSNGAILDYELDSFGRIRNIKVLNPGIGFKTYPTIRLVSPCGVNATFRPVFEVVRDPIVVDEDILIQVTDLVGLKRTGFVDGRSYFGAVFYKDGVRYAGFYQTPGKLVQVYDTRQESITGEVTTRPSAIQREGTDTGDDTSLDLPS
jgi:hypothetical protein